MDMVEWFMEEVVDAEGNRTQARVLSEDEAIEMLRQIRTPLLKETDFWMSVDRYNALSAEAQTELTTYRQALRDVPQSPDPFNPNFPNPPSWL